MAVPKAIFAFSSSWARLRCRISGLGDNAKPAVQGNIPSFSDSSGKRGIPLLQSAPKIPTFDPRPPTWNVWVGIGIGIGIEVESPRPDSDAEHFLRHRVRYKPMDFCFENRMLTTNVGVGIGIGIEAHISTIPIPIPTPNDRQRMEKAACHPLPYRPARAWKPGRSAGYRERYTP